MTEKDWPRHKRHCEFMVNRAASETPFDRNLRLWMKRFTYSLAINGAVALDLGRRPQRSGTHGMVLTLNPRPHRESGSRFVIDGVAVIPLPVLRELMETLGPGGGESFDYQMRERQRNLVESRGADDFSAMVVVALNEGENKIPEYPRMALRYKPLPVHDELRSMINSFPRGYNWEKTLRRNVRDDVPTRADPNAGFHTLHFR